MDMQKKDAITGIVTDIQRFSVHDGQGIRTIVFLKGCPLRCKWCHNPETNRVDREVIYYSDQCIGCGICVLACPNDALTKEHGLDRQKCCTCGSCAEACCTGARQIVGKVRNVEDVICEITRDKVFFSHSGGGLTVSGGEPTMQSGFAAELMRRAHENGLNTALETCGHCSWEKFEPVVAQTDLFLYDVKHVDDDMHRKGTGVGNRLILDNLRRIAGLKKAIVVRIPLIPGFNDSEQNLRDTAALAKEICAREIHILPFHQLGENKWKALEREYQFEGIQTPDAGILRKAKEILSESGLPVNIGGHGEFEKTDKGGPN